MNKRLAETHLGSVTAGTAIAAVLLLCGYMPWRLVRNELSAAPTQLMFFCPIRERSGVRLVVDDQETPVSHGEPWLYPCDPGMHRVTATRTGFTEIREKVELSQGRTAAVALNWATVSPVAPTRAPTKAPSHDKLPVPSETVQRALLTHLDETYPINTTEDFSEHTALVGQLMKVAEQTTLTPAQRFTMLYRAAELACGAGDLATMVQAVEAVKAHFVIVEPDFEQTIYEQMVEANADPARIESLVATANQLVDRAIAADRYDVAFHILDSAATSCQTGRANLLKNVQSRKDAVKALEALWSRFRSAADAIKSNAKDPQANLTIGTWYCFYNGQPEHGWPFLTKGSDEAQKAAQQEIAPPTNPEGQKQLGDAWSDPAKTRSGDERDGMTVRAGYWYQRAWDAMPDGPERTIVGKRLEQIAQLRLPVANATLARLGGDSIRWRSLPGQPFPRDMWVSLLEYIDPNDNSLDGHWSRTGNTVNGEKQSLISMPVDVGGDYDLECKFAGSGGSNAAGLVFVVGNHQCRLCLERDGRLMRVNERLAPASELVVTNVAPFTPTKGQKYTVLVQVRLMGEIASIAVQLDNKPYLYWTSKQEDLDLVNVTLPSPRRLALAAVQPTTFHDLRLRSRSWGKAVLSADTKKDSAGGTGVNPDANVKAKAG